MAKHQSTLADLVWMEKFLQDVRGYIANNPLDTLEDRTEVVMSAKGTPVIKVIATKEQQVKALLSAQKEALQMLGEVDRLREEKEKKDVEIRGGGQINGMMAAKLNPKPDDEPDK